MTISCIILALALIGSCWLGDRKEKAWAAERKELMRRVTEPRAVQVQERPMHPKPPVISQLDDKAYKKLREERMN